MLIFKKNIYHKLLLKTGQFLINKITEDGTLGNQNYFN